PRPPLSPYTTLFRSDNYVPNTVVYTGTHDNPPTRGWYEDLPDAQRRNLWRSVRRSGEIDGTSADAAPALLHLGWSSVAALAMAPLQDVLNLGNDARMNRPGSADGNWRWRSTEVLLSAPAFESLVELARASSRPADVETANPSRPVAMSRERTA